MSVHDRNPTVMENPRTGKILEKFLNVEELSSKLGGITLWRLVLPTEDNSLSREDNSHYRTMKRGGGEEGTE